jgi:hypothetical protein
MSFNKDALIFGRSNMGDTDKREPFDMFVPAAGHVSVVIWVIQTNTSRLTCSCQHQAMYQCTFERRYPKPYSLHPTNEPDTLYPIPYILHPTPYTLHPTNEPYNLHPKPYILHPTPEP